MATHPTVDEVEKREEEAFKTGPLSVLTTSVKSNSQVWLLLCLLRASSSSWSGHSRARQSYHVGVDQLSKQQKAAGTREGL